MDALTWPEVLFFVEHVRWVRKENFRGLGGLSLAFHSVLAIHLGKHLQQLGSLSDSTVALWGMLRLRVGTALIGARLRPAVALLLSVYCQIWASLLFQSGSLDLLRGSAAFPLGGR